eukprot:g28607.t1
MWRLVALSTPGENPPATPKTNLPKIGLSMLCKSIPCYFASLDIVKCYVKEKYFHVNKSDLSKDKVVMLLDRLYTPPFTCSFVSLR